MEIQEIQAVELTPEQEKHFWAIMDNMDHLSDEEISDLLNKYVICKNSL